MTFVSDGTGHAVEVAPLGAGPFEFDWSGNQDSGFAGSDGSTGNETILINPDTASANITLNIIGGSSTPSVMEDAGYSGTFAKVINPVSLTVTIKDVTDASNIENARVLVLANTGGDLPAQSSITSISQSSGTATVSHTAHGLEDGKKVLIEGVTNDDEYNGVQTITVTGVDAYTYTVDTGTASPATGTITGTAVIIDGLTNGSGIVSDTRSYTADQPITGRARKSSASTYYQTGSVTGTVDSTNGLSIVVQLIPDE
jgi:hypothetical protein